jgi:hypothetical protein
VIRIVHCGQRLSHCGYLYSEKKSFSSVLSAFQVNRAADRTSKLHVRVHSLKCNDIRFDQILAIINPMEWNLRSSLRTDGGSGQQVLSVQPHFIKISVYNGRSISEHRASCCVGTQKADVCRRYFTLYSALSTHSARAFSPKPEAEDTEDACWLGRGDGSFAFSSSLDDEKISKFKNTTKPDRHSNVCAYVPTAYDTERTS